MKSEGGLLVLFNGWIMKLKEMKYERQIEAAIIRYEQQYGILPGIAHGEDRIVFIEQLVESLRRMRYIAAISKRPTSPLRADPASELFDPEKAAVYFKGQGNIDEAFWMVFLSVHFGKNKKGGWGYVSGVYARGGEKGVWSWQAVSADPAAFRNWLDNHKGGLRGGFGNHRKYESLDAYSNSGTGSVVESYVDWVGPARSHSHLINQAKLSGINSPIDLFDHFYKSLRAVKRFGRLAKFDYLAMVGKLGLANIKPGSTYMNGATGPLDGARLLFDGTKNSTTYWKDLDDKLVVLEGFLGVGMQPLEDALCNWQKSPGKFIAFRG